MNDALRSALADARLREVDVASALSVDPKTVQRWLTGRVPHPRHRWAVADLLKAREQDIWPDTECQHLQPSPEVRRIYPYRSAVPREEWMRLFRSAEEEIDILAYAALFLAEDLEIIRLLAEKARSGIRLRLLIGDPASPRMIERGIEEGIGDAVAARVHNAVALLQPLLPEPSTEMRQHDTVLYNSIFRADGEMFVNTQVYGIGAAYAPVLHLAQAGPSSIFATYVESFERVWNTCTP